ncbi:DUF1540 domain-containing protein [Paenibacillus bouchesdurhonensis]|uniref:DUF1540 domain-containing protein n=1 Tax=Paenibacillus bouchesdurhonensis TaxID=1870990 RepID=UPI000DA63885|nr:DUF1540 domain-containing protein [Paenibacillus bouchesdurhonensis]
MPNGNKPIVRCSVSNCSYWGEQNYCNADLIMIDIDKHADRKYDAEFAGEEFDSEHKDTAASSAATCCHTFKPKSS